MKQFEGYEEYLKQSELSKQTRQVYGEKAHVPDGDAEVSADGWTEYGAPHRYAKNQCLPNSHHGEPCGADAFQGAGDHG